MKASIGKKIAVMCLSAAMAVGLGFGFAGIKTAQAKSEFKDVVLDSYKLDTVVTVTDEDVAQGVVKFPKQVEVSEGVMASAYVLTYPDGVSVTIKDSVTLSQLGKYQIAYKDASSNVYYDTFVVHNNFVDVSSAVELRERTTYTMYELDGTNYKKEKYGTVPTADAKVYNVSKGVRVTLEAGMSVTFNNIIDSNVVDDEGFANLATVNLTAVNRSDASLINKYFDLIFTDVNDPNNFFKVTSSNQVGSIGHSFGVETATTPLIGTADTYIDNAVEKEGSIRIFYVDGVRNAAYLNQTRTWGNGEHEHYDYSILYNPTTKVIKYRNTRWFNFENGRNEVTGQDIIIDLDNADIFDEGATLFKGFSTGEVKLTLQARDFSGLEAYVDVYSLGTIAGEELQAYYNADTIVDETDPTIRIDVKKTDVNGVYTAFDAVNKNVKFAIPQGFAQDANACSEVTARVYKNYAGGESAKVLVPTNDDGTFTVAEKVVYTIEYRTQDIYGNVGVNTLNVIPVVASELPAGEVQVNEGIKFVFDKLQLVSGRSASLPVVKFVDTLNTKSDLTLDLTVTKDNKVVFSGNYNYAQLSAENKPIFDFKPVLTGDYVVKYVFADNASSKEYVYTTTCTSENIVEFASKPLLNRAYILGMTYGKPDFSAFKFADTVEEAETTVEYSYDNGATWTAINDTFVMGADATGNYIAGVETVMFRYSAAGVESLITDAAPIVDVRNQAAIDGGYRLNTLNSNKNLVKLDGTVVANDATQTKGNIDQGKYFITKNAEMIANSTKLVCEPTVTEGDAKISFINPLMFNELGSFFMQFETDVYESDFNEFTITLTDAYDPTNSVYFSLFMLGEDTRLTINGGKAVASPVKLHGSSLTFTYSLANQMVTIGSNSLYNLAFNPTGNLFYVDVTIGGITGENASVVFTTFGNHAFRANRNYDSSAPMLFFESAAGSYPKGSLVTIKAPTVADIISPYITSYTKISVKCGADYVTSVEGALLDGSQDPTKDYTIYLNDYATWKVEYMVEDTAGKSAQPNFNVIAADMEAPVITLAYGFNESTIHNVTLGKTFSIEYSVSDNLSPETKIKVGVIIIRDSDFFTVYTSKPFESLEEGEKALPITDSCIITRRGMYTAYVIAFDEAKNMTIVNYKLNVQ